MKKKLFMFSALLGFGILFSFIIQTEPWTKEQLMKPATLAEILQDKKASKPVVYNIGPSGKIPGSVYIGATQEKENLKKLEKAIKLLPKNTEVVLYCGCCPFEHCPNIRPAFQLLKENKIQKPWLLDLPANLKADWIDKGYPIEE